jgi:hypothetical protein
MLALIAGVVSGIAVPFFGCSNSETPGGQSSGSTLPDAGPPIDGGSGTGCAALTLVQDRCGSCHSNPPQNGAPVSLVSLDALRSQSQFPGQTNAQRAIARMSQTAAPMPPLPAPHATEAEIAVLQGWVDDGMPDCADGPGDAGTTEPSSPNLIPQDELFACDPTVAGSSPSRVRRIDQFEFRFALPNEGYPDYTGNPFYANQADQYSSYSSDETLDLATLDLYLDPTLGGGRVGTELHDWLKKRSKITKSLACMFSDVHPDDACVTGFLTELLTRDVLFRPPGQGELDRLRAFANGILAAEIGIADRPHTIARVGNAAWFTTGALFRPENAGPNGERAALSDWELADAVAYTIGERGPGGPATRYSETGGSLYTADITDGHYTELAQAAADGTIHDPAVIDALMRKYVGGDDIDRFDLAPYMRLAARHVHGSWWTSPKVRQFFREWLGYEQFATVFKDVPSSTSQFGADPSPYTIATTSYRQLQSPYYVGPAGQHEDSMIDQLDDTIARIVVEDQNVLSTLLTSSRVYVNATSHTFNATGGTQFPYNLTGDVPEAGRWITLPANERAGILTHPGWLGAHGDNFEDDPSIIHRGHWIRENLLCQYIPPLSEVKVAAVVGPSAPDQTARSRVETATASAACQGCHKLMNSLGEPFEIYNHAGFLRVKDHDGSKPNGSSVLVDMPDPALDGPVADGIELSQKLAASNHVKRCFVRQTFRYFAGRDETRADACSLVKMEKAYDQKGSFLTMLSAFMTSEAFLYRAKGAK